MERGVEVRHDMGHGERRVFGSGWRWDKNPGTWMEVRRHLGGGEMQISRAGLRWDTTWRDVRRYFKGPGWIWDMTWMDLRWQSMDLDGSEREHGWRSGNILRLRIQVGQNQDGGEMYILKSGWVRNGVSMDLICHCWGLTGGKASPGMRWYAIMGTWIRVRLDLDGGELWI